MKFIENTTTRFFFIIILVLHVFACSNNIKKIEFNKEEQRLIDSIHKYNYNNPDKAIALLHEFLKGTKDKTNRKFIYGALAYNHKTKNSEDSTLYYFQKGLNFSETTEDIVNYKYEIGLFYEEHYNYEDALIYYKQCFDLAKAENSLNDLKKIHHSLKLLKNKVLESEEALLFLEENYSKEKGKATKITDKNIRYIRKDLIEAYVSRKQIDKALLLIEEGTEEANTRNNMEFLFSLFKLKAEAYLKKKEMGQAIKACDQAKIYSEVLQNQKYIDQANYVLAKIKLKLNEPEEAISLTQNILVNKEDKSVEQLSNYYKLLADSYEQIDSSTLSVAYHKKHNIKKESATEKRIALIDNIDRIGLDEEILERKKQEGKTLYWNIAFVVLLLFGFIFFLRNKKIQKNNQKKFDDLMLKIEESEKDNKILKVENVDTKTSLIETSKEGIIKTLEKEIVEEQHIDDEKVSEILLKIKMLEDKQYFLRQDCTLHNMAKKLKTNTTYLSRIFNTHLGKTFSAYLNALRINYIIIELKNNKRIRAYSTKAISQDLGYKTVDSFNKYFKQATGITPSVYIKKLQKETYS